MNNFIKVIGFLRPYKTWALIAPLLIILEVIMELMLPKIMANIVNIGIGNKDVNYILTNIFFMFGLTVIGVLGGLGSAYYATQASQAVGADIRKSIFEKISQLSFVNLDKIKEGHIITIITNDITLISNIVMMGLRYIVRVPIIMIGSIVIAITISYKLSVILFIIMPLMILTIVFIINKAFPYFKLSQESVDNVNTVIRENLGGIRVVKSFVSENYEIKKFDQVNKEMMTIMIKAYRFITMSLPLMMLFINGATVLVLWYGGYEVVSGRMDIGNIIAFIEYLTNILTSLLMTSFAIIMLSRAEASAKRVMNVFDQREDIKNEESSLYIERIKGKVEFKNVSFSYHKGSGEPVLKDISFVVEPGETVGILGSTGSGKTTLINLIARFYDVTKGQVLIDDINIKNYKTTDIRKNISVVFQKAFLFSDTIKNNIKYGSDEASDEEIIKAAKIAHAHEFIIKKEKKYDHWLEQGGGNLSGGQKQRLSLARGILFSPSILILDDATSAVDVKTEKRIKQALKKNLKGKTTFIVTQKITSIINADKIIVLDEGEISGIGNHYSLLENNEVYNCIYKSQTKTDGDVND